MVTKVVILLMFQFSLYIITTIYNKNEYLMLHLHIHDLLVKQFYN